MTSRSVIIWLIVMLICVFLLLKLTHFSAAMSVFLPNNSDANADTKTSLLINTLQQQQTASLLMISIGMNNNTVANKKLLATSSRKLRTQLADSNVFNFILNGDNNIHSKSAALLFKYRYLLDRKLSADSFSVESLNKAFKQRLEELRSPAASIIKRTLAQDPIASGRNVLRNWRSGSKLSKSYGVWFNADETAALLIANIKLKNYDIDRQEAALNTVRQVFDKLNTQGNYKINISGPGVFAVASRQDIKSDSMRLSIIATIVILLIFILAYRSVSFIILGSLPLASAVLVAITFTSQLFGNIHGITITFGITLLGLSTDYPVHFFSHLRNTKSANKTIDEIWPTIRLGVITTCIGFVAMLSASIEGLMQLGVFSIIGLTTAALVTRYVVPVFSNTKQQRHIGLLPDKAIRIFSKRIPVILQLVVLILVTGLGALYLLPVNWQQDLTAISPLSDSAKMLDQRLRNDLKIPDISHVVFITGNSADAVLEKSEKIEVSLSKLQAQGVFSSYRAAFQFLPSAAMQTQNKAELPATLILTRHVKAALRETPFRKDSFSAFISDVEKAKSLNSLTIDDIKNTPLGTSINNLMIKTGEDKWLALIRFNNVTDKQALSRWAQNTNDVSYVNIKDETSRIVLNFRDEAVNKFAWGALLIFAVLLVALKDIKRSLKISLSLVLSIGMVVITLNLMAVALSLFHIIALLLVLGLGLDYSLFFSRVEHDAQAKIATLQSLLICFVTTLAVFVILATSSLQVLQAIGLTTVLGVIYSMIFSWLFASTHVNAEK